MFRQSASPYQPRAGRRAGPHRERRAMDKNYLDSLLASSDDSSSDDEYGRLVRLNRSQPLTRSIPRKLTAEEEMAKEKRRQLELGQREAAAARARADAKAERQRKLELGRPLELELPPPAATLPPLPRRPKTLQDRAQNALRQAAHAQAHSLAVEARAARSAARTQAVAAWEGSRKLADQMILLASNDPVRWVQLMSTFAVGDRVRCRKNCGHWWLGGAAHKIEEVVAGFAAATSTAAAAPGQPAASCWPGFGQVAGWLACNPAPAKHEGFVFTRSAAGLGYSRDWKQSSSLPAAIGEWPLLFVGDPASRQRLLCPEQPDVVQRADGLLWTVEAYEVARTGLAMVPRWQLELEVVV